MSDWLPIILIILLAILGYFGSYFFLGRNAEIDLIPNEEKELVKSVTKLSEKSFEKIWDNEEDSIYDEL